MDLRINDKIVLQSGRFSAIVAPTEIILAGLNDNPVLERYTSLLIGGNFSRLLNGMNRTSGNFEIQRAFTVHQLLTILREDDHSVVIVEHDPTIYDDAGDTKRLVSPTMKDVSRNCIFVLYAPAMDPSFAYLTYKADYLMYYDNENEFPNPGIKNYSRSGKRKKGLPQSQKTLV
jgi:DNA polymerase I